MRTIILLFLLPTALLSQTKEQYQTLFYALKGDWVIMNPQDGWKYISFGWGRRVTINGNHHGVFEMVGVCEIRFCVNGETLLCNISAHKNLDNPSMNVLYISIHRPLADPVMLICCTVTHYRNLGQARAKKKPRVIWYGAVFPWGRRMRKIRI